MLVITAFGLGYFTAQFSSDNAEQSTVHDRQNSEDLNLNDLEQLLSHSNQQSHNRQDLSSESKSQKITLQQQNQIKDLIQQSSDEKIETYLGKIYPKIDLSSIQNKKQFSQRLIEEFSQTQNEPHDNLVGRVVITQQEGIPQRVSDLSRIHPDQYLYAHLDTLNKVPNNRQVFIRWIYRDTGEVIFFMPQNITANQSQNWVNFKPTQGWKTGTYDVRYYQFADDLTPIAQTSYTIRELTQGLEP